MRTFQVLSEILARLAELDTEFIIVHDGDLANTLSTALKHLDEMAKTWQALQDEEKLKAAVEAAAWKRSQSGNCEYAPADALPLLAKLLREKGRVVLGPYAYVLSKNGRWINRFPRGEKRGG